MNLADIGLDTVGLDPSARSLDTDEAMQVQGVEGLWAIGDITGKGAFTHMSMYQAAVAVRDILGQDGPGADYRAVPRVTFTDPEIGSVGLSEQQARDAGLNVRTGQVDLTTSARGWIHQAGNAGLIKLVEDADTGELIGATTIGPNGGEVLSALVVAIHGRGTDGLAALDDLRVPDVPPGHRGRSEGPRLLTRHPGLTVSAGSSQAFGRPEVFGGKSGARPRSGRGR